MNNPNLAIKEFQNLILANFERMVAFEQAAFNTGSKELRVYFEAKATESENNITELTAELYNLNEYRFDVEREASRNLLGTTQLFTGQKNMTVLLKHIQYLEKAVLGWYKKGMKNLKGLSHHTTTLLGKHYTELQASHLYVQTC